MEKYYVAYGSNLNSQQMVERIGKPIKPIDSCILPDWKLTFAGRPIIHPGYYATIVPGGLGVPVVIYAVDKKMENILDACEGVDKHMYFKHNIDLFSPALNKNIRAFTYLLHEPYTVRFPGPNYIARIISGYMQNGISLDYLTQALRGLSDSGTGFVDIMCQIISDNPDCILDQQSKYGAGREA